MFRLKFHLYCQSLRERSVIWIVAGICFGVAITSTSWAKQTNTPKSKASKVDLAKPHDQASGPKRATALPKERVANKTLKSGDQTKAVKDPFAGEITMPETREVKRQFIPTPEKAIPKITLRGIVVVKGKSKLPIALIEVAQHGVYVVRPDDTISLQKQGASRVGPEGKVVLRIEAISKKDVTVQLGSLGEEIIVR